MKAGCVALCNVLFAIIHFGKNTLIITLNKKAQSKKGINKLSRSFF